LEFQEIEEFVGNSLGLHWLAGDDEYCHATVVAQRHLNSLLDLPKVKPGDAEGFKEFAYSVHSSEAALADDGLDDDLNAMGNLRRVVSKLPESLSDR
jgi:hypothetical protein